MKEKLIASEPKLRGMDKVLSLLESEEMPDGEVINWKHLDERVEPYHSVYEFTENVRAAIREYITEKLPSLKEKIPAIAELEDDALLNALTHNWFEEIDEVEGQRREILLTVVAHIVKRIESFTERTLFKAADAEKLAELGIDSSIRDLTVDLLEVSAKADAWFVRFLAYSQLSGEAPEYATPVGMHLPDDPKLYTTAELFPHEAQFIARRFREILEKDALWKKQSGATEFISYLESLAEFFESTKVHASGKLQREITERYEKVLGTDFPVILTSVAALTPEGYYKEPYIDPELKVSLVTPEAQLEEKNLRHARDFMAESLGAIDAASFADNVRNSEVKSAIVLGAFGSNLTFNTVAQEDPGYLLYLNEQIRAYDNDFPPMVQMIEGGAEAFANLSEAERDDYIKRISRMCTMFHEFGHPVERADSPGAKRLGGEPLTTIDEIKAETLWRGLIPAMLEKGLRGTREQWATAQLIGSIQVLKDQGEGDEYYAAEIYNLNELFERGIVQFQNGKVLISDINAYYEVTLQLAREVLLLYRDKTMTEQKAKAWLKKKSVPSGKLQALLKFAKSLAE